MSLISILSPLTAVLLNGGNLTETAGNDEQYINTATGATLTLPTSGQPKGKTYFIYNKTGTLLIENVASFGSYGLNTDGQTLTIQNFGNATTSEWCVLMQFPL